MTRLDKFLAAREWFWNGEEFVTVCDGVGFVVWKVKSAMMLAGVTPDELAAMEGPKAAGFWIREKPGPLGILAKRGGGRLVGRMFEIPASPEVVSAAVNSAFNLRF